MIRPLVSIITPTFPDRADVLLNRCVRSALEQTYPSIEHLIVSDGSCGRLPVELAVWLAMETQTRIDRYPILHELGYDSMAFFENRAPSVGQILVGSLLAKGEYQAIHNDDNLADPAWIETLVDAMERDGTDFAYSAVKMIDEDTGHTWTLGSETPQCGNISAFMVYRRECLKMALRRFGAYPEDWDWIARIINAGARWSYVPEVLYTQHYCSSADNARFDPPRLGHPLESWGMPA